jgi:hypothetical protein
MSARIAGEDLVVSGTAVAVPWSEDAALVLTSVDVNGADAVALVPRADGHVTAGRDLGGQRRDAVVFNQATVRSGCWRVAENTADILLARAAAVGVVEMAAAAEVLQLTVGYAKEREQFGVPIASFQVVQHHLASLAGNVAALQAAAHLAVRALSEGDVRSAAAAKVVRRSQRERPGALPIRCTLHSPVYLKATSAIRCSVVSLPATTHTGWPTGRSLWARWRRSSSTSCATWSAGSTTFDVGTSIRMCSRRFGGGSTSSFWR